MYLDTRVETTLIVAMVNFLWLLRLNLLLALNIYLSFGKTLTAWNDNLLCNRFALCSQLLDEIPKRVCQLLTSRLGQIDSQLGQQALILRQCTSTNKVVKGSGIKDKLMIKLLVLVSSISFPLTRTM